jgi:hypothetical protein
MNGQVSELYRDREGMKTLCKPSAPTGRRVSVNWSEYGSVQWSKSPTIKYYYRVSNTGSFCEYNTVFSHYPHKMYSGVSKPQATLSFEM